MLKQYDIAVFIARIQPVHMGHMAIIQQGLKQASKVVVLVGSASSPRWYRNPWTFTERSNMLYDSLPNHDRDRVLIFPLEDATYNEPRWLQSVQTIVQAAAWKAGPTSPPRIALIGHSKDHTSFYLKKFPQWDNIEVENYRNLNSTQIRNVYFSNIANMWLTDADGHKLGNLPQDHIVPSAVKTFLDKFILTPEYRHILDEYNFVNKYRLIWANTPYPVNLVCIDSCVIKAGHVLVVERGAQPGKGLLALPGGYLNVDETAEDGMIRELREETKLKVPDPVLRGSIIKREVFDDPNRSSRGRVLTIGYLIDLGNGELDKVKGSDDAAKAFWLPLSDLDPKKMFEDHIHIIRSLLGI